MERILAATEQTKRRADFEQEPEGRGLVNSTPGPSRTQTGVLASPVGSGCMGRLLPGRVKPPFWKHPEPSPNEIENESDQ